MKLRAWLDQHDMTAEQFADCIRVSVHAVNAWCQGARRPSKSKMPMVIRATSGAVQPNDFFDVAAAEPSDPSSTLAAIFHQLGGHAVIAEEATRVNVPNLEMMEAEGRVWPQYRRPLVEFARIKGFDLDAEKLVLRPLGRSAGKAA